MGWQCLRKLHVLEPHSGTWRGTDARKAPVVELRRRYNWITAHQSCPSFWAPSLFLEWFSSRQSGLVRGTKRNTRLAELSSASPALAACLFSRVSRSCSRIETMILLVQRVFVAH